MRGQANMTDESKLRSPVRSTFEVLVCNVHSDVLV